MSLNMKIRTLQWFYHILALLSTGYICYIEQYQWFLVSLASWVIIGPVSTVITLHRLLTHRSFKTYSWLENVLSFITIFTTVGPTIAWVSLHRLHHSASDTNKDPHSPNVAGKFSFLSALNVWLGYNWKVQEIPISYVKDLMRQPLHRWIYQHYFKTIIIFSLILILINPMLWVSVYVIPASLTVHLIGIVNIFGHSHGYRSYNTADQSTNSWIANIVSLGEGWHNNHHAHPTNWYTGEKWWEWDLMGLIIRIIKT